MERSEIRLELIKLAHTHGRDASEAVGRARQYEKYVLEAEPKPEGLVEPPRVGKHSRKNTGKPGSSR